MLVVYIAKANFVNHVCSFVTTVLIKQNKVVTISSLRFVVLVLPSRLSLVTMDGTTFGVHYREEPGLVDGDREPTHPRNPRRK